MFGPKDVSLSKCTAHTNPQKYFQTQKYNTQNTYTNTQKHDQKS